MTTITIDRAVLEQALEALELVTDLTNHDDAIYAAMDALRAALAQEQAEPVQEPAAWAHPTQGFVRWRTDTILPDVVASYERAGWTPLYAAPPQRKPLTDEEILQCFDDAVVDYVDVSDAEMVDFARAIERALEEKNRA